MEIHKFTTGLSELIQCFEMMASLDAIKNVFYPKVGSSKQKPLLFRMVIFFENEHEIDSLGYWTIQLVPKNINIRCTTCNIRSVFGKITNAQQRFG